MSKQIFVASLDDDKVNDDAQRQPNENINHLSRSTTSKVYFKKAPNLVLAKRKTEPASLFKRLWTELTHHRVVYESNEDGTQGNIIMYDELYTITIGWLIPRRGSIFSLWAQIVSLGFLVAIVALLGNYSCNNVPSTATVCVSLPPTPSTSYLTLITLCSFVVGIFSSIVIGRWWSTRLALGDVLAGSGNLLMLVMTAFSVAVQFAKDEQERRRLRGLAESASRKIIGLLMLHVRLLFNTAREDQSFYDLVDQKFITREEHEYLKSLNVSTMDAMRMVTQLLQEAAHPSVELIITPGATLPPITSCISGITGACAVVQAYTDVQLPYGFIQMISVILYAFLIQLLYVCAGFVGGTYTLVYHARFTDLSLSI
jgi:Bestrophin, RFP-TM, chloride channel